MNCQSSGVVTLRSDDPLDAPVIDSKLLSHPYDLQVATEVIRSAVQLLRGSSIIPTEKLVIGPKSLEDAEIEVSCALSTFCEICERQLLYRSLLEPALVICGTPAARSRWGSLGSKGHV